MTKKKVLLDTKAAKLGKALIGFAKEIDISFGGEKTKARKEVLEYISAVEKGANEKARRAERHKVLLSVIHAFFLEEK